MRARSVRATPEAYACYIAWAARRVIDMLIRIPELSLVVLIGPSGAGKSTFARTHFADTEILSSDHYRGVVADDETDQSATKAAFEVLHLALRKRLERGRLTVIDATNVEPEARRPILALAREHHVLRVAIVLDVDAELCHARNASRSDRAFGPHVVEHQLADLHRSRRGLEREGFRHVFVLEGQDEIAAARIERVRMCTDRRDDRGPFDIIGDVHGCREELEALLARLGYARTGGVFVHEEGRRVVFLGDLVDRGPDVPGVLEIAMSMREAGSALCVPGNHESKLLRKLQGRKVTLSHGLPQSVVQLEARTPEFRARVAAFIDALVSHYVLDGGHLVVAHAGMKESMQGRDSRAVQAFALYGDTTGESDEYGLPVRYPWAEDYRGSAAVVYGHTPVARAEWLNNTICIDTGCVFGGDLTALRWPERELVAVAAARVYCEPKRPPQTPERDRPAQRTKDENTDGEDSPGT